MPGGPPTEEYQCKANRRNGRRCRRYALRTSDYCQFHGGRGKVVVKTCHLPMFYSKHLGRTLQAAVEEQLGMDPSDQLNLFEELALIRSGAGQAVKLYDAALTQADSDLRLEAARQMRDWLDTVRSFAESAARVKASGSDKISVHDLKYVVAQVTRIMWRVCGEDHEFLAKKFERLVREEIKMPHEVVGTDLTPDLVVTDMDATVPNE